MKKSFLALSLFCVISSSIYAMSPGSEDETPRATRASGGSADVPAVSEYNQQLLQLLTDRSTNPETQASSIDPEAVRKIKELHAAAHRSTLGIASVGVGVGALAAIGTQRLITWYTQK